MIQVSTFLLSAIDKSHSKHQNKKAIYSSCSAKKLARLQCLPLYPEFILLQ